MSQRGVSQREAEGRCHPRAVGSPKGWQPVLGTPGSWGSLRALWKQSSGDGEGSSSAVCCTRSLLVSHRRYVSVPLEALLEGLETSTAGSRAVSGYPSLFWKGSALVPGGSGVCRHLGQPQQVSVLAGSCPVTFPSTLREWERQDGKRGQRGIRGRSLLSQGEELGWGGCCTALGHSCRNPV